MDENLKKRIKENAVERVNDNFPETETAFGDDRLWLLNRGFLPVDGDVRKWRHVAMYDGDEPDETITTTVTLKLEFVPDNTPKIKDMEEYERVLVNDTEALFVDGRYDRSTLPEGLFLYDLRGSDEDPGDPVAVEENVCVNHAGCVIMAEPIHFPEEGFVPLEEGLDFIDEGMTIREFYVASFPRRLYKWGASETVSSDPPDGDVYCLTGPAADTPFEALVGMFEREETVAAKEAK